MNINSASILICTYNRAAFLKKTLASLQAMTRRSDYSAEIIVVDNNSTDDTAAVVDEYVRQGPIPVACLHESRQGKSFALNTGLMRAKGDVLALTDDDVLPGPDWLDRIVDDFRAHEVTFVFGKVLPLWAVTPPPELLTPEAQALWGPLAILDYGDSPAEYVPTRVDQRLPIGANLAISRATLTAIGGWRTDLGKVNNTLISGEDHEIFTRLLRRGLFTGFYDPELTVRHHVPAGRLTRRYFRRWFFWHGKTQALMLDDLFPELGIKPIPWIAGVPRFLYRQALEQCWSYVRTLASGSAFDRFEQELLLLRFGGLFLDRWRAAARSPALESRTVREAEPAMKR